MVVLAAALAAGALLRGIHQPRHRPVLRSAAGCAHLQPGQPVDLVDEHPVRAVTAVLRHPPPQLSRRADPGRVRHAVPALVVDHARAVHLRDDRRTHLHGPGVGLRAHVDCGECAFVGAHRRDRARSGRGGVLHLLLSRVGGPSHF